MKISIIGIGAIGGYIAAKLLNCKQYQIQLLVKPDSPLLAHEQFCVSGLTQFTAPIDEIISDFSQLDGDIIFITTKSTSNTFVFDRVSHLQGKIFIILQNGIGAETELAKRLNNSNAIVGAISNVKLTKGHQLGQVILHSDFLNIVYATAYPALKSNVRNALQLPTIFKHVFRDVHSVNSIYHVRFPKLMINIACNAASIIYNQTLYGLSQDIPSQTMIGQLSEEVRQVALYYGVSIKPSMMVDIIASFNAPKYQDVYFSMKQDFDLGLPLEMQHIFYSFIELATKANINVPATQHAITQLVSMLPLE
ncbi:ketopantoate reductase family protein [Shewanella surugensis]|uniref:2-dehydropantoate 2-reductase n=1 Tax=Shewanella surugensis TaxID=212020 RepID=A0ABT0LCB4_9GAMM|nr:2-dehydropantoate 2-reductase N-terminal domain-containing protein [Shewanella surugensis]MCL1124990.1 hypothetical protein [Shewanella surugensis]